MKTMIRDSFAWMCRFSGAAPFLFTLVSIGWPRPTHAQPPTFTFEVIRLEITKVEPPEPIEHTPIRVFFTLQNHLHASSQVFAGTVQWMGESAEAVGSPFVRVDSVGPVKGVVTGLAPVAGQALDIVVAYFADADAQPGVEFPGPTLVGAATLNVAATYEVRLDNFTVDNPRALRNDTVNGECTVLFGGRPLPNPQPTSPLDVPRPTQASGFGNRGAGSIVPTPFAFGPFGGVPGLAPDLEFNFVFANDGFSGSNEESLRNALDVLSGIGQIVASGLVPAGAALFPAVHELHKQAHHGILPNCDGVVAADQITMRSDVLAQLTLGEGSFSENRAFEGSSSPGFCGIVSHYHVKFTVLRTSFRPS